MGWVTGRAWRISSVAAPLDPDRAGIGAFRTGRLLQRGPAGVNADAARLTRKRGPPVPATARTSGYEAEWTRAVKTAPSRFSAFWLPSGETAQTQMA